MLAEIHADIDTILAALEGVSEDVDTGEVTGANGPDLARVAAYVREAAAAAATLALPTEAPPTQPTPPATGITEDNPPPAEPVAAVDLSGEATS